MSHEKILLREGLIVGLVLVGYKAGVMIGAKNFLKKDKEQSIEEDERKEA